MKKIVFIFIFCLFSLSPLLAQLVPQKSVGFQNSGNSAANSDSIYQGFVSCGTCMFKMEGKNCMLAVKIQDSCYVVQGAGIDDFGDAHAVDGFCNAIHEASLFGKIGQGVFYARKIVLAQTSSPH